MRWFWTQSLPLLLLLGGVVAFVTIRDRGTEIRFHGELGRQVTRLQAELIRREFRSVSSDLLFLADRRAVHRFLEQNGDAEAERIFTSLCARKGIYDQVRLLDLDGRERLRVNNREGVPELVESEALQRKADRYYVREGMKLGPNQVYASPFDLNVENGEIERPLKPVIRFATPIFDEKGNRQGLVVLNYLGEKILQMIERLESTIPGQIWLLNREGYWLRGPRPEWEWTFMTAGDASFRTRHPDVWQEIQSRAGGSVRAETGLFTFQTLATPEKGEDALRVVRFLPSADLVARSNELLGRLLLFCGGAGGLLILLLWFLERARRTRRADRRRLEESESRLRRLSRRLLTAQEEERQHISRDLHDDLGQVLTAICLDLERLHGMEDPERRTVVLDRALEAARSVLQRLHRLSARLRPSILDDFGLEEAVQSLLGEFEERSGVRVRSAIRLKEELPTLVTENLYRILQEALTNVEKHAEASLLEVSLRAEEGRVDLVVTDDGVGFDPGATERDSLGLLGMQERVELLGGNFELSTAASEGTTLTIHLPVERHRRAEMEATT